MTPHRQAGRQTLGNNVGDAGGPSSPLTLTLIHRILGLDLGRDHHDHPDHHDREGVLEEAAAARGLGVEAVLAVPGELVEAALALDP